MRVNVDDVALSSSLRLSSTHFKYANSILIMSEPKNESDLSIRRAAIASLLHATLLAATGGYLDAFTFVGKGRVFANSMTGNVVIMGTLLAIGQWRRASARIPLILAFMVGTCCAKGMDAPPLRRIFRWPLMTSLTIEIVFLLVAGALPMSFPDSWLLMSISFAAALQNSTFARIEGQNLSTIMTTGNLKTLSESLVTLVFGPSDLGAGRRVRFFTAVCFCFLAGAVLGARLTPGIGNLALWPAALILLIVWLHLGWALWSIVKRERR
jgi:uncharacterized membrane protein YoaK (UPF0700 family)